MHAAMRARRTFAARKLAGQVAFRRTCAATEVLWGFDLSVVVVQLLEIQSPLCTAGHYKDHSSVLHEDLTTP